MNLYVRLRTFLAIFGNPVRLIPETRVYTSTFSEIPGISENVEVCTRMSGTIPPVGRFYSKNVRNRTLEPYLARKKTWMKNNIFSRRNLDFNFVNLELFSVISELSGSFRTRLHMVLLVPHQI